MLYHDAKAPENVTVHRNALNKALMPEVIPPKEIPALVVSYTFLLVVVILNRCQHTRVMSRDRAPYKGTQHT